MASPYVVEFPKQDDLHKHLAEKAALGWRLISVAPDGFLYCVAWERAR